MYVDIRQFVCVYVGITVGMYNNVIILRQDPNRTVKNVTQRLNQKTEVYRPILLHNMQCKTGQLQQLRKSVIPVAELKTSVMKENVNFSF